MRKKRLYANTLFSIINQFVVLICGFILSRFILKEYGSEVNGLLSSITQFLGFISMLDLGVGAVIQSTLYKPLADEDNRCVSLIFNSAKTFFRTIALILLVYVVVLCFIYPKFINRSFNSAVSISLILTISISSFTQYFFAVPHQLLLNADQRMYVQCNIQTITVILNTIISVILIVSGSSIQTVKLAASIVFLIRPAFLTFYVKKNYSIDYKLTSKEEQIEQKWNGMAQHCATVVMNNTDVIILSVVSTLSDVSVYSVYNLVLTGIRQFMTVLSNAFMAPFGNIFAKKETELLNETFAIYEWFVHTSVVFVFAGTIKLIVPFVLVYTRGITDTNYEVPLFAVLICCAQAMYCFRIPYNTIVCAACHYRETQTSAIIEMVLNIVISLVFVHEFGLVGVAIGTIVAMTYRTFYFVWYLKENILARSPFHFVKHLVIDVLQILLIIAISSFVQLKIDNYIQWIVLAIIDCAIATFVVITINVICYSYEMKQTLIRIGIVKGKI